MALTIGVDVGGTKVAAGVVDDRGRILEKVRRPTPSTDPRQTAEVIAEVVDLLKGKYPEVEAVGLGAAGFVDEARATVLFAPNLAWRDEPIKGKVEELVGLPVVVENDANATAWGEFRFGAGRGERFLVLVALGTGIGGGIIVDGRLYRGRFGIGGEIGHLRMVPDGRRCGCGNRGCWEQYASGNALVHEARDLARVAPLMASRLLELGGGSPEGIRGPEVTQAAREGDRAALECFRTVAGWVGRGLADLTAILDPGAFIIGGGLSDAGDLLLEPVRDAYEAVVTGVGYRPLPDIRIAELGSDAGLVGAADLARQR
ncbi:MULTISPECIES: ROK family glucokinase [Thermomonospora]|uniref:Glucokinase n=1 Tax=Thermomonospora curvata (strain ATCC 19995 / DSM 43183 / JCM 3096 / KCTC 9072 / NBRC 15933 / NCIMB 10081 / Henssen B9) TaxID=471852 RepID=D1A8V1_THECD|nr:MULTISPECIES: ROK family glucokinase [Thermomonospora]ACY98589.1 glucokinase, ROK family [Thermomonospora curvata DSM 43183]PKK13725.1 MAG: glucokinase [Thermomonospora sp. CIF 1]